MIALPTQRMFRAQTLDMVEKYAFAAVFFFFTYRMWNAFVETGSLVTLFYMLDQFMVLIFILMRRPPQELSLRFDDWAVGLAGTLFAVMIGAPSGNALLPEFALLTLLMLGFSVHLAAKLALRRSFGVVAANRGVKVHGPYRYVRHPMYLGYILSQAGVLLAGPTLINAALVFACWVLFIARIVSEERVLSRDPAYLALCATTRWRLIPGVY